MRICASWPLAAVASKSWKQGVELEDVSKVFLAGTFGKNIRSESLGTIGLIPKELASDITLVGNSTKAGATMALLSKEKGREQA